jgi:hypothetical protein
MTRDKYLEALGLSVLRFENRFVFQEPENQPPRPGKQNVNISKSAIPATPPSKGGETYLFINQIIIVVFVIKIFLKLTAMGLNNL